MTLRVAVTWRLEVQQCAYLKFQEAELRSSAAARLLMFLVRIPPGALSVCGACSVLSGRGLCNELITRQEEP